jgi:hypothetical protein
VVRKLLLNTLVIATSLLFISSCRQNSDLSYYYGDTTGAGGGNGCGCGCCGCCNNDNTDIPTCDSTITIVDQKGTPIQGATVTVYTDTTEILTTNYAGEVDVTDLQSGQYVIKIEANGYEDIISTFTVADGICPAIELTLIAEQLPLTCYATATVDIVNFGCGAWPPTGPLPGAVVIVDGNSYVTDVNGQVTVPSAPGFSPGAYPITIKMNSSVDCSLTPNSCRTGTYNVTTDANGDAFCPRSGTVTFNVSC